MSTEKINELSPATLASYQDAAGRDFRKGYTDPTKRSDSKTRKTIKGFFKAQKKLGTEVKEGQERDYTNDFVRSLAKSPVKKPAPEKSGNDYFDHMHKKTKVKKLKEEEMINESLSDTARELVLHADNDAYLHRASHMPIMKNLSKKMRTGKYSPSLATKLWGYHADRAAHSYAKEHGDGTPWHKMFSPADRRSAAAHWEESHRDNLNEAYTPSAQSLARAAAARGKMSSKAQKKWAEKAGTSPAITKKQISDKPQLAGMMDKPKVQQAPTGRPDVPSSIRQQNQAKQDKFYAAPANTTKIDPAKKAELLAAIRNARGGYAVGDRSSAGAVKHAIKNKQSVTTGGMTAAFEEVEHIEETLTAADPVSKWISDFVHSKSMKFDGVSKEERKRRALGAFYAAKRSNEEVVPETVEEALDPVGKEDADIDNNGKLDKTDVYLHAKRNAIRKNIKKAG